MVAEVNRVPQLDETGGSLMKTIIIYACTLEIVFFALLANPIQAATVCADNASDLQTGLQNAQSNGEDDIIQIVEGTYPGNFVYQAADTEAYNLTLEGGYAPDTSCTSRVVDPKSTVLDGKSNGSRVLTIDARNVDQTIIDRSDFAMDGLTLQNGLLSVEPGAGLYVIRIPGNLTLSHNIFHNNYSADDSGGGAYLSIDRGYTDTRIELTDNAFSNNRAKDCCGGVRVDRASGESIGEVIMKNNTFSNNIAETGSAGGAYIEDSNTVELTDNIFSGNSANDGGGGLHLWDAATVELTDAVFSGNSADNGGGAKIENSVGLVTLNSNTFRGNAAIHSGGGISINENNTVILTNNTFSGNASDDGGGIYIYKNKRATLINNTLTDNTAYDDGGIRGPGAGIWLRNYDILDRAEIYNNIIWGNNAPYYETYADLYIDNEVGTLILLNNDFDWDKAEFNTSITINPTNLNNINPKFVDATNGNLHLQPCSPVINLGDNGALELPDTDMDGDDRIIDTRVDIGADEFVDPVICSELEANKTGTGDGTVTSSPAGIDCGLDCSETYPPGTTVDLTPSQDASSSFGGWSGCDSISGVVCSVTMNTSRTVTADFDYISPGTLSINKSGTGGGTITSSPVGIDCGIDCSEIYAPGTTVYLTSVPDISSSFGSWSGCDLVSGDVCSVTMNASRTVTVSFFHIMHTLTADKFGTGTGSIVSNIGVIDCGTSCGNDYVQGTTVDLTSTAEVGSVFNGWSGCDAVNGDVCSLVMNTARLITATFNVSTASCATMTIHQTDTSGCPSLRTIVSLQGDQGLPVTGLVASNFGLDEDGIARAIRLENGGTLAVSLVIDKSGSLSATDLVNIRQACIDFIGLLSPGDSVAVYQFGSTVRLLQDYTTDLTLVVDAVNSIASTGGGTALYDSIFVAAEHADGISGRKGVIVLTDGRNNASSHTTIETIEQAISAGAPVFTIGFGNADPVVLTDIADQTGGLYYTGVGSDDLQDMLARLGAVLNSQYVLLWNSGFVDGGVHGVTVEALWPSCSVSATTTYTQAGSACGASCMAVRSLPMGYAAESAAPVAVAVQPDAGVQTYAVEDIPPSGMSVSSIDNGGLLDNGKVKWGPFFDNQERNFNYEITPPSGTQGNIGWSGVLSRDGISEAICGDTILPQGLVHPADLGVSGDNWGIEIDELTAYATAWKSGTSWSRAPNPIPLPYAVNVGYLWQNGENYHYDPFLDPPWDASVTTNSVQKAQQSVQSTQQSGNAVSSFNPRYYTPGIPVDVILAISPPLSTKVYAVEETPPEGWVMTDISHSGKFNAQSNQIRWGLFFDDTARNLTYTAMPPLNMVDTQSFVGQAAFDQLTEAIGGQRTLLPLPCTGDTLHIHDVTFPSDDDITCSASDSIILGENVDMKAGSSLELQAGTKVTFLPPLSVQKGGVLVVNGGTTL